LHACVYLIKYTIRSVQWKLIGILWLW